MVLLAALAIEGLLRLAEGDAQLWSGLLEAAGGAFGAGGASLRCLLASQAGLAAGWRIAARPSNTLTLPC